MESLVSSVLDRTTLSVPATPARARWLEELFGREAFEAVLPRYRVEDMHLLWRRKERDLSALGKPSTKVGKHAPAVIAALGKSDSGLLLKSVQNYDAAVAKLLGALRSVFGAELNVNAYVSLRPGTIFDEHWDTHDVLMLQTAGTKRWHLRANRVAWPVHRHRALPASRLQTRTREQVVLAPGSILFLPRGVWHHGRGRDSIHLSFGFSETTVASRIERAVKASVEQCFDRAELRLSLDDVAEHGRIPQRLIQQYVRNVIAQLRRDLPGRLRRG